MENVKVVDEPFRVKALRTVTPAGVVAIFIAVISGYGDFTAAIDRNCRTTKTVAENSAIIASVDTELSKPANRELRTRLIKNLNSLPKC